MDSMLDRMAAALREGYRPIGSPGAAAAAASWASLSDLQREHWRNPVRFMLNQVLAEGPTELLMKIGWDHIEPESGVTLDQAVGAIWQEMLAAILTEKV